MLIQPYPRLLMYRDSFANGLAPELSEQFSQAVYLSAVPTNELYYDVDIEKPDVVIIEFTERNLFLFKWFLVSRN